MERARRPYADMPEAPTQAPDGTGNKDHMDNQIKVVGCPPVSGNAVPESNRHGSDDNGPREDSPPPSLQITIARSPTVPTIALDSEERTAEDNSKPDQDQSNLQLPAASRPVGEEGSVERLVELERSQKIPREPPTCWRRILMTERTDSQERTVLST